MKGQLSLEFLIIFAAFLSLLLVWVSSTSMVSEKVDDLVASKKAKFLINELNSTLNEVYVLRGNNLRVVAKLTDTKLSSNDNLLTLTYNKKDYKLDLPFAVVLINKNSSSYQIYYADGVIIET